MRFSAIGVMISFQLLLVGFITSVAAYAPSTFGQWRQDDQQQPYFNEWRDTRKPGATLLFNKTDEDKKADLFAVPSSVYGEWRRDPPYVFSQEDKLSEADERMEDIAEAEVRPPIDSYIGIGYDLLKGNPEGDFTLGGLDPGLRLRSIFKLTDARGRPISRNSQDLPTQIEHTRVHTCSSVHRVNAFSGTKSYQKKLDVNVKLSGGGNFILFSFRFSLSSGFSLARAKTTKRREVLIDTEVVCNVGRGRYLIDTALNNNYSISDDFYYSVKNLPAVYNRWAYMSFIRRWGTHIIVEADIGGRLIKRYKYTYAQMYKYASTHVSSSVSVGGSYKGFRGSKRVDINSFNSRVSQRAKFSKFQYTVNSGSTIQKTTQGFYRVPANDAKPPIPIAIKLRSIILALDPRLWTVLPEKGQTYASLNIARKRRNLERALKGYPAFSKAPRSSDPSVRIPNAWPDGAYTLPMARSGCPSGGGKYRWHTGNRYQDTRKRNRFSRPLTLAGYFNRNIRTYFCTKTDTTYDYGIEWPKGSYCIARKGGSCPDDFEDGWISWDDKGKRNRNTVTGILPDGTYNKDTRIDFCCRRDGFATNKIILPTDKPFYLYRYGSDGCQRVAGMRHRQDWVQWDCEGTRHNKKLGVIPYVNNWKDIRLFYCYYY